ncbi:MAG: hypothetical protein V3R57_05880 [Candidatus Bathyarchaeia archaeon]
MEAPSFDEYHQLNDMKQDTLLILYGRERATCPEEISSISLFTMNFVHGFENASNKTKNMDGEQRAEALEDSLELVEEIKAYSNTDLRIEHQGIIDAADRAIKEFLTVQAKAYVTNAEEATATGEKIYHYKQATNAYYGADETLEAENLKLKWQTLERDYLDDLVSAGELISSGDTKYSKAMPMISGDIVPQIDAYILSRSASIDYSNALVYYTYHLESDKVAITLEKISVVSNSMGELRQVIAKYFSLSLITLIGLSLYLLNRLKSWRGDTYDYSLGNELVRVRTGGD